MKRVILILLSATMASCGGRGSRADILYLKAREYRDSLDLKEAVLAYGRAEEYARKTNNDKTLALVYRDLGSIFLEAQDFPAAAEFYNKAAKAKGEGETYQPDSKIEMIPEFLASYGLDNEAYRIKLLIKSNIDSLDISVKRMLFNCLFDSHPRASRRQKRIDYKFYFALTLLYPEHLYIPPGALAAVNKENGARRFYKFKQLFLEEKTRANIASLHNYLSMSETAVKAEQNGRQRKLILVLLLSMILLSGAYAVFALLQRRRAREEMAAAESLRKTLDNLPDYGNMRSLLLKQTAPLLQLGNDYFSSDSRAVKEKLFKDFSEKMEALRDDRKVFSSFEEILNACHDGVMDKLHADFPEMKPKTSNILAMLFLGLSYSDITLLSRHHNPSSLKTFKSHYKKVFSESGLPSAPLYLSLLERQ